MATKEIDRRTFVGVAALAGALALKRGGAHAKPRSVTLMSAARFGEEDRGAVLDGEGFSSFPLPARGHGMAELKDGRVMLVGRRPATFAAILERETPERARVPCEAIASPATQR